MRRRLAVAASLVAEPRVLFLDEPTTGLDPAARLFVWDRIRDLRTRGVTMILTTHDMDEAAQLCERVGIMDRGKILAMDTPDALTATVPGKNTLDLGIRPMAADRDQLVASLGRVPGVERLERVSQNGMTGPPAIGANPWAAMAATQAAGSPPPPRDGAGADGTLHFRLYASVEAPQLVGPVAKMITDAGGELSQLAIGQPSLEDVFIHLTGRTLR